MPLQLGTRLGCGFKACAAVLYYQWRLIKADMDKFWLWPWEQADADKACAITVELCVEQGNPAPELITRKRYRLRCRAYTRMVLEGASRIPVVD